MADEKLTAAFILSLLGGVIILIVGVVLSLIGAIITGLLGVFNPRALPVFMSFGSILGFLGILYGIIIIVSAIKMYNQPENQLWGILIVIFSVLSLFGAGAGLYIGLLLGVIGGLLGLTWKPSQKHYPQYTLGQRVTMHKPEITMRYCPFCGTKIDPPGARYRKKCGAKLTE